MGQYINFELAPVFETFRHDFHFPGHLIPGTAFIIMGVWWIWNTFKIYSEIEQKTNSEDHENLLEKNQDHLTFCATYNGEVTGILSCEGFYKVAYASFDLFCHILVLVYGGEVTDEKQHMTVYVFFILNGVVDLWLHMKVHKMPDGTDYLTSSVAWVSFGYLFLSHKHAKTEVSIFYHQILGWLAIATGVVTLLQYKYERNTLIALTRGSCCVLTGTWLYQIAFSFHNPFIAANQYRNRGAGTPFDNTTNLTMSNDMEIMNAVTASTWHVLLVGTLVVVLGYLATRNKQFYYKRIRHCCV